MILEDTAERRALGDSVRRTWSRIDAETDHDRGRTVATLAALGVTGLGVHEDAGGSGGGLTEVALVLAAAGFDGAALPLLGRFLAVRALLTTQGPAGADLLRRAAGAGKVALVASSATGDWQRPGADVSMTRSSADEVRVAGVAGNVLDPDDADVLLVVARTRLGLALVAVESSLAVFSRLPALDPLVSLNRVVLDDVRGTLVAEFSGWSPDRLASETLVLLAAEASGGARGALDLAMSHARERVQFGRPIGAFQAVRHRLVDLALSVDRAETALGEALGRIEREDPDAPLYSAVAGLICTEVYEEVAGGAIQVFGGLGFTWEHPAHLHLKRARTLAGLRGHPSDQLLLVADHVGLAPGGAS